MTNFPKKCEPYLYVHPTVHQKALDEIERLKQLYEISIQELCKRNGILKRFVKLFKMYDDCDEELLPRGIFLDYYSDARRHLIVPLLVALKLVTVNENDELIYHEE